MQMFQCAALKTALRIEQVVVIDEDPADDDCVSAAAAFLARVLQYQETPQYLRKCDLATLTVGSIPIAGTIVTCAASEGPRM